MNIGFTGTQVGMTDKQKAVFTTFRERITEFHHGCCIGADYDAHKIVQNNQYVKIILHPPENNIKMAMNIFGHETRKPKPYLIRNHDIVDESELLIATPKENLEQLRSGTWATIRYAIKKGKPVVIILPDGRIRKK